MAERSAQINEEILGVKKEIEHQNLEKEKGSKITYTNRSKLERYLDAHEKHLERMSQLTLFENILSVMDQYFPHFLSLIGMVILLFNICERL